MTRCSTSLQGCLYAEIHTEGCLRTGTVVTCLVIQTHETFLVPSQNLSLLQLWPCVSILRQSLVITLERVSHSPKPPECWGYWHVTPRPYLFFKIVLLLLLLLFLWGRRLDSRSHGWSARIPPLRNLFRFSYPLFQYPQRGISSTRCSYGEYIEGAVLT